MGERNRNWLTSQLVSCDYYIISQNMVSSPADSSWCLLHIETPRPDSRLREKGLELGPGKLLLKEGDPGNHTCVRSTGLVYIYYRGSVKLGQINIILKINGLLF